MTLDDILAMWSADSKIDEMNLDETSIKGASLHAKYLELYSHSKLRLRKREHEFAILKKDKWMYYNGKMSKPEMDAKGWPYDPFNGLVKPLKSDMDIYYDTDADVVKLKMVVEYQQTIVETLKDILDNLRWRHTTIKNIITWKQFVNGS
jgi:hypothetical protein